MTKYYIKKRERKESFVWIYLNTCIWLSCSFVRCKGKMKFYSDLSDSEYGLHKFSAYPLFSGRLCNSQNKSMKTKQYVCAGKNNILGLAHKDSWRAGRFSWKKCAKILFFSVQIMNFLKGQVIIPFCITAIGPDFAVFCP